MIELDLPPRIIVGANGAYWRDYDAHRSMCPVSTDNDPIEVVAVYVPEAEAARLAERLEAAESRAAELEEEIARLRHDASNGRIEGMRMALIAVGMLNGNGASEPREPAIDAAEAAIVHLIEHYKGHAGLAQEAE